MLPNGLKLCANGVNVVTIEGSVGKIDGKRDLHNSQHSIEQRLNTPVKDISEMKMTGHQ